MTKDGFVAAILALTLAATGWSWAKLEGQGDHLAKVVATQGTDREDAVLKNVEARYQDCVNNNEIRSALRTGVLQGQKEQPLLLKLLPQFNEKHVLALIHKEDARQLKAYRPLNCTAYSQRVLPPVERNRVTLRQQQAEIQRIVAANAKARVTTVTQRCELTQILERNAPSPQARQELAKSLAGCQAQLVKVKRIASSAGG